MERTVGIYVHIPFCRSRCTYCDFYSLAKCEHLMPKYQNALLRHIKELAPRLENYMVDSVYFGGGTPSHYGAKRLIALFNAMKRNYNVLREAEVTLEANPESIEEKDFARLKKAGFNRVSIGVQSANDAILRHIGRLHDFRQAEKAVEAVKNAGFDNIGLDLIYGLPGQSRLDWADTVSRAAALKPRHFSCYGLKIEEGTPIYQEKDSPSMPDEDMQADMYLYTVEALDRIGYRQYEISNFAMRGYECRHNLKYWKQQEYIGFGASASSYLGGLRFMSVASIQKYIDGVCGGSEIVSQKEEIADFEKAAEYLMLGMRTTEGISEHEYCRIYRSSFEPLEELLRDYRDKGWAKSVYGRWSFTPQGFLLSNHLISELLDAQAEQKTSVGSFWKAPDYKGILNSRES